MSRLKMPASVKSGKSETKKELEERNAVEETLKGNVDLFLNVPEHLSDTAKQYYKFIVDELEVTNILSNLDIPLLEQISDSLARIKQCDDILNEEGIRVYEETNFGDKMKEHPMVNTKIKYLKEFRAMSNQLGLSPASRANLAALKITAQAEDNDIIAKILRGEE